MFSLVQRKIKTDQSVKGEITTMRVRPGMYFNFANIKANDSENSKAKTVRDFQRALSKAMQAFDDVMEKEMGD